MRRSSLTRLAILLLCLSAAAPVVSALEDCRSVCAGETEDGCGTGSPCCSCCPVLQATVADVSGAASGLGPCSGHVAGRPVAALDADPQGVLHVPKARLS